MKNLVVLSIFSALIIALTSNSALCLEKTGLEVIPALQLNKFEGVWYEIAHNPWFPENNCFATIAYYKLIEGKEIEVTNICRKHGFEGKISKITGKAWLLDPNIKAKWQVQFIWPFILDYWVIELDKNYNYAVIGEPDKENFWILSRQPIMGKNLLNQIIEEFEIKGYDLSNLIMTPQSMSFSRCLTKWLKKDDYKNNNSHC